MRTPLAGRPRRALGQYFTPPEVAHCAVRALASLGVFEAGVHRVVDPAAGAGHFLEAVREAAPAWQTVGLDIDPALVGGCVWHGNGLLDHAAAGITEGAFDLVVGNPPYGGLGLSELLALLADGTSEAGWTVAQALQSSDVLAEALGAPPCADLAAGRLTAKVRRWLDRVYRHPIENLFIERFVRLLRAGGWMAVVVPEGVLANARAASLRAWLAQRGRVTAIVGLPRVFARAGAAARTALLVYQKVPATGGEVAVSDVEMEWAQRGQGARRPLDLERYLAAPPTVQVPWGTLRAERWDPQYWDPRWAAPLEGLRSDGLAPLGRFISHLTYGPIVTGARPQDAPGEVPIVSQGQIEESGVNLTRAARVAAGCVFDPPRCRVQAGDLLFPRSGAGSLGRNRLAVFDEPLPAALGCFVDVIRLDGINPWFVWVFLKTRFGWGQVRRLINGVGMPNISFDEIRSLQIVVPAAQFQDGVERRWRAQVQPAHQALVAVCGRGDAAEAAARAQAERCMRALVADVEAALAEGSGRFGA